MSKREALPYVVKAWAWLFVVGGVVVPIGGGVHVWQRYQRIGSFERAEATVLKTWDACDIFEKISKNKSRFDSTVPCAEVDAVIATKFMPQSYSYRRRDFVDIEYRHSDLTRRATLEAKKVPPELRKASAVTEIFLNPSDAADIETRLHSEDYRLMAMLGGACVLMFGLGVGYLRWTRRKARVA